MNRVHPNTGPPGSADSSRVDIDGAPPAIGIQGGAGASPPSPGIVSAEEYHQADDTGGLKAPGSPPLSAPPTPEPATDASTGGSTETGSSNPGDEPDIKLEALVSGPPPIAAMDGGELFLVGGTKTPASIDQGGAYELLGGTPAPATEKVAVPTAEAAAADSKDKGKQRSLWGRIAGGLVSVYHVNYKQVLGLMLPELPLLFVGFVALGVMTAVMLAVPQFMGSVIDSFAGESTTSTADKKTTLMTTSLILAGMFLVGSVAMFVRAASFAAAGERVVARLRKTLFNRLIIQEIGFFDVTRTGEIINRLTDDTQSLRKALTQDVALAIRQVAQAFLGVILLFVISWKLTLVMLASVPPCAVIIIVYGGLVKRFGRKVQDTLAKATTVAEETVSNIRTVHAFGNDEAHRTQYNHRVNDSRRLGIILAFLHGSFQGAAMLIGGLDLMIMLWYGGTLVIDGEMSSGELLSFLLYTVWVAFSLAVLSQLYGELMRSLGASDRIFALMGRKPQINTSGGVRLENIEGRIEFAGVKFTYPSRPEIPVLRDLTLAVEPGTVVALVGPSGGGKSTIANVILRLYDVQGGSVKVDGVDIHSLDIKWLRQNIASVSQEPVLFSTSIAENIAYARPSASIEEVISAAKSANCFDFIDGFPEKFDTVVGERGVRLSGGQKQRVAIARAILKDPRLLILDEATSALDAESEHLVQEALERLMVGRTVVVIAHRLSTIKRAHKIAVINKGELVQLGSHDELLGQPDGLYAQLVSRQLSATE